MYLNEFLPLALKIGIRENEFWGMTMKTLTIHVDAYKDNKEHEIKSKDEELWRLGVYIQKAVASCLSKKAKYPEEPLLKNEKLFKKELTADEKAQATKNFFMGLKIMQSNFEMKHKAEKGE